jgi:predicted nucleic acid-binding protein
MILETTFLVDLERELSASGDGPAHRFLGAHSSEGMHITFTIAGELAAGGGGRDRWERFIAPFPVLEATREVCWRYGELHRYLRTNGLLIGTNDLWIAATALAHDLPVVTRNVREFKRVPGLAVLGY